MISDIEENWVNLKNLFISGKGSDNKELTYRVGYENENLYYVVQKQQ